tara:strand:- start:4344 stop:5819 length:1476 start_codon:yes stop_codon:yes gene_type:complete
MAKVTDLRTLAKTSVTDSDYFLVSNSNTGASQKLTVSSMFPAVSTAGTSSETLYTSATLTNKNQIVFKGIKSGDTGLLTVATTSNNIVLTALEAGIDLSLCNNTTAGFLSSVDFTGTVTGENGVTNGGTGLSTIAKGAMLYADATDSIKATAAMSTNGQLLIGNATTGIPTLATLTAGTNVTITNTAGAISIAASLSTMAGILDMANNNIDLGTAYLSADGSTSQGIRVTAANTYLGTSGNYFNSEVLNIGGSIAFNAAASIKPNATTSSTTGSSLTIESGGSADGASGSLNINAGSASGSGQAGSVIVTSGKSASGTDGDIQLKTYTGSTATAALTIAAEGQNVTVDTGDLIMSTGNVYMRNSSNPDVIKYQGDPDVTDDGTSAITADNILTGIITCTPTGDRSKATDTAANLVSGLSLNVNNDSFDFSLINLATSGGHNVTLTGGTGVTLVGNMVIFCQDAADDAVSVGVGRFRIRRTGSSAVTIYRIG